jgi:hypothetical protein
MRHWLKGPNRFAQNYSGEQFRSARPFSDQMHRSKNSAYSITSSASDCIELGILAPGRDLPDQIPLGLFLLAR